MYRTGELSGGDEHELAPMTLNRLRNDIALLLLLFAFGCEGDLSRATPMDSEPPLLMDARVFTEGGADVGLPDARLDAVADATPDAPLPSPCDGVECRADQECEPESGECRCPDGSIEIGGVCRAFPEGDPTLRTPTQVCEAWRAGHEERARPAWTAGGDACDVGVLAPEAVEDTVRRVNMFRWLTGLPSVTDNPALRASQQACALMMDQNGMLSHSPGEGWRCYDSAGAMAAGRSNIALGYRSPGDAIDGYMRDRNTPSLGHRRWILHGRLGRVGIGFAGRGQCLQVFDSSGSTPRSWTAYPNPGPAPLATASDLWSLHSRSYTLSGATVTVSQEPGGEPLSVRVSHPERGFGPNTIAWRPEGWAPTEGETYLVRVSDIAEVEDVVYEVELVECD